MSFSYNSTAPGSSARSYVRLRLGDTSSGSALFEDEELDAFLSVEGNRYLAAAVAAESLGARNASKVDKQVGRLRISMQQASAHYFSLAKRLRLEANTKGAPYAGGISKDEKQSDREDTDLVQSSFKVSQFDFPGDVDGSAY